MNPINIWEKNTLDRRNRMCKDPVARVRKAGKGKEVAQSCPTLCDPMDCSPTGSSVHGIFQARVLEWVAISFSKKGREELCNWME